MSTPGEEEVKDARPKFDPDDPLSELRIQIYDLDEKNGVTYEHVAQYGVSVDTAGLTLGILIGHLKKAGVITEKMELEMALDYHKEIENQLEQVVVEIRRRQAMSSLVVPQGAAQKPTLVDARGNPFVKPA